MRAIILIGGPGAGKGTLAEGLSRELGMLHVSTGEVLRAAVRARTPMGREVESCMKSGDLVPDELMIRIVESRLADGSQDDVYMLDGFPRTVRQAEMLDEMMARRESEITHVFNLESDPDVLVTRLIGRRICKDCGASYHVVNIPPQREGICDICMGELYQRADDSDDTIANRIRIFKMQMHDLIAYYENTGKLVNLSAGGAPQITEDAALAGLTEGACG